mmetsp:Transcript_23639/g.59946  ORF Transcript_23639/g.59946 Transcript_23639/m.59946 type:complete len:243 (-) Transcript_23639:970-1698(-)
MRSWLPRLLERQGPRQARRGGDRLALLGPLPPDRTRLRLGLAGRVCVLRLLQAHRRPVAHGLADEATTRSWAGNQVQVRSAAAVQSLPGPRELLAEGVGRGLAVEPVARLGLSEALDGVSCVRRGLRPQLGGQQRPVQERRGREAIFFLLLARHFLVRPLCGLATVLPPFKEFERGGDPLVGRVLKALPQLRFVIDTPPERALLPEDQGVPLVGQVMLASSTPLPCVGHQFVNLLRSSWPSD